MAYNSNQKTTSDGHFIHPMWKEESFNNSFVEKTLNQFHRVKPKKINTVNEAPLAHQHYACDSREEPTNKISPSKLKHLKPLINITENLNIDINSKNNIEPIFVISSQHDLNFLNGKSIHNIASLNFLELIAIKRWAVAVLHEIVCSEDCIATAENKIIINQDNNTILNVFQTICRQFEARHFDIAYDTKQNNLKLPRSVLGIFTAVRIASDCSCFYNSISQSIFKHQEFSALIRLLSVRSMLLEPIFFNKLCLNGTLKEQCLTEVIKNNSDIFEFACYSSVISLTISFSREIIIITDENQDLKPITLYKPDKVDNKIPLCVFLEQKKNHFSCLLFSKTNRSSSMDFEKIYSFKRSCNNISFVQDLLSLNSKNNNQDDLKFILKSTKRKLLPASEASIQIKRPKLSPTLANTITTDSFTQKKKIEVHSVIYLPSIDLSKLLTNVTVKTNSEFIFDTRLALTFLNTKTIKYLDQLSFHQISKIKEWAIGLLNCILNSVSKIDVAIELLFLDNDTSSILKGFELACKKNCSCYFDSNFHQKETKISISNFVPKNLFIPVRTEKNGSCFYNSISLGIFKHQEFSPLIRLLCIRSIVFEEKYFEQLCFENILPECNNQEIVSNIADLLEYASYSSLICLCICLSREVFIITDSERESNALTLYKPDKIENETPLCIFLQLSIPHYSYLAVKNEKLGKKKLNQLHSLIQNCNNINYVQQLTHIISVDQTYQNKNNYNSSSLCVKLSNEPKIIESDLLQKLSSKQKFQELFINFRNQFQNELILELKKSKKGKAMLQYIESRKQTPNQICICCNGLFFERSVLNFELSHFLNRFNANHLIENKLSVENFTKKIVANGDSKKVCRTCKDNIFNGIIPQLAPCNGFGLDTGPDSVLKLSPLEERFLSPYIPFLQFVELNRWSKNPQLAVRGTVVNVPIDLGSMMTTLPRNFDQIKTAHVQLKRKIEYSGSYMNEVIDVDRIANAFNFLKNSTLWKENQISENVDFFQKYSDRKEIPILEIENDVMGGCANKFITEIEEDINDELKCIDLMVIDRDVELAERGQVRIIAPGEGKSPVSRRSIKNFDELCYPSIFCGEPLEVTTSKSLKYKYLARHSSLRATKPHFVFHMAKIKLEEQVYSAVQIALRKVPGTGVLKASEALNSDYIARLIKDDNAYSWLSHVFGAPAYWAQRKKEIFAMIRQLGLPTFFFTFSVAETYCPELLKYLYELQNGVDTISFEDALRLDDAIKNELIRNNPVGCVRYWDNKLKNLIAFMKNKNGTFSEFPIEDYVYRIEYQARGAPHVHGMVWCKNAPQYKLGCSENDLDTLTAFADKYISAKNNSEIPYVAFQQHNHGTCCHKGTGNKTRCRFGFPKVIMPSTKILEPHTETEKNETENTHENYIKLKTEMVSLSKAKSDIAFEDLLLKLEMSEDDYIQSLRYGLKRATIFYQRGSKDLLTNSYNPDLSTLSEVNMDMQLILHPYGAACYMVEYIFKSVGGFAKLIKEAAAQAKEGNQRLSDVYKQVANSFINNYQMCAQEAAAYLLSHKQCVKSRSVIFINTSPIHQRTRILKGKDNIKALEDDSTEVLVENDIDRYTRRPTQLENVCLADFVGKYYRTSKAGHQEIYFERSREKILRWRSYNLSTDPSNFYRVRLMLFLPWRDENKELTDVDYSKKYHENIELINKNALPYIPNSSIEEELEKAYCEAETAPNDYNDIDPLSSDFSTDLFKNEKKTEEKCTKFSYPKPEKTNFQDIKKMMLQLNDKQREFVMHCYACVKNKITMDSGNFNQKNDSVKISPKIILQGAAGTGKSTVIKCLDKLLTWTINQRKGPVNDSLKVLLTAFAGSAAFSIGGVTLHSGFNIPAGRSKQRGVLPELSASNLNSIAVELGCVEVNIIDEYSMAGNDIVAAVQGRWKQIKGCQQPFGSVTMILVGDLNQLDPVGDSALYKPPNKDVPFNPVWNLFQFYELDEVMRQDNENFVTALNNLAKGTMTELDEQLIKTREVQDESDIPQEVIRLYFANKDVRDYNDKALLNSPETSHVVDAEDTLTNEADEKIIKRLLDNFKKRPASETYGLHKTIEFKKGLKYMVTNNVDVKDGIVNGMWGKLEKLTFINGVLEIIWLNCNSDKVGKEARYQVLKKVNDHKLDEYKHLVPVTKISKIFYQGGEAESAYITRKQFPLVCAEAIIIHKSQGQTYHQGACVDLRKFNNHYVKDKTTLLYVAFSRVTELKNLYILGKFENSKVPDGKVRSVQKELQRLRSEKRLKLAFETFDNKTGNVIIYLNARSLIQNHEHISADKWYQNGEVLIISETNTSNKDNLSIKNYHLAYQSNGSQRKISRGVHCYAKDVNNFDLLCKFTQNTELLHIDLVVFEIFDVIVISGYSSPKTKTSTLLTELDKFLIKYLDRKVIILGDFNIDNLKNNDLRKYLNNKGFDSALADNAVTTDYSSQLDLIFANFKFITAGVYESYFSDHKPIHIQF